MSGSAGPQAVVAGLARRMTAHGEAIAQALLARQIGDPIDVRRDAAGGRRSGVARPTEASTQAWDQAQRRDARQLGRLLLGDDDLVEVRKVHGAAVIAAALGHPIPTTYRFAAGERSVVEIIELAARRHPDTPEWRGAVRVIGLAWHVAAEAIHDGWSALYMARWVCDAAGMTVLDDQAAAAADEWVSRIKALERALHRLRATLELEPAKITLCAGEGCRRPLGDAGVDGLCRQCSRRPCGCDQDCGRQVERGQGRVHPTCRQAKRRRAS